MNISFYNVTVPLFTRGLHNLLLILDKTTLHAQTNKPDIQNLLQARLAPDMFNCIQQVQYSYYHALDVIEKIAGRKAEKLAYEEKTVSELKESINRVLEFLTSVAPEEIDGKETLEIPRYDDKTKSAPAFLYVTQVSLPNFYFHITTAYDILRANGVPLHKTDYLQEPKL